MELILYLETIYVLSERKVQNQKYDSLFKKQTSFSAEITAFIFTFHIVSRGFPDSLVGKESVCNAGDSSSIPGWGRSTHSCIFGLPLWLSWQRIHLQCWTPGFDPWVGKIPWSKKGYPLQYSGLENSMDCIVHVVAKSQTQLSNFHFHSVIFLRI